MSGASNDLGDFERALAAYEALREHFYQPGKKLYRERDGKDAYAWPYSQALAATIDLAGLPGIGGRFQDDLRNSLSGLERYWNGRSAPPAYDSAVRSWLGGGGDQYYDDNEWIGLDLVQVYRLNGDRDALERAGEVFAFVVDGWDDDPNHPAPGGVFWMRSATNRDRNAVSNAPGALLGLRLHEATGARDALDWARRMYDWVVRTLRQPDGLYADHIDLAGQVDRGPWSYNQGTMVGAGVLLARATGDVGYLDDARRTAAAALAFFGQGDRYDRQGPAFNAIYFQNLLLLAGETGDRAAIAAMQAYADHTWQEKRDPATNLFTVDPRRGPGVLDQSAMVRVYAMLAATLGQRPA